MAVIKTAVEKLKVFDDENEQETNAREYWDVRSCRFWKNFFM